MKLPFVLPFAWLASLLGMDYTPPAIIPDHLKQVITQETSSYQDMPKLEADHHHKRLSKHIEGTVGDVKIDIIQNETLSKSTDTDNSAKIGHSTKFVAILTSATALITATIGAGVTFAVKYGDCKKN